MPLRTYLSRSLWACSTLVLMSCQLTHAGNSRDASQDTASDVLDVQEDIMPLDVPLDAPDVVEQMDVAADMRDVATDTMDVGVDTMDVALDADVVRVDVMDVRDVPDTGSCTGTQVICGGTCVDTLTDPMNCGTCEKTCNASEVCVRGSCAARSCAELLRNNSTTPSGRYTLDPDGTGPIVPFEAYCDMTTMAGGWTLLLKADGRQTVWTHSSARWTDNTVLNETSAPTMLEDAKYPAYNSLPFTSMRLVMRQLNPNPPPGFGDQSLVMTVGTTAATMRAIQSETPADANALGIAGAPGSALAARLAGNAREEWEGLLSGPRVQCGCSLRGINVQTANKRFRIGMFGNEPAGSDCPSTDSGIGIGGVDDMTSLTVVGSYSDTQWDCSGPNSGRVTRTGFAWVWVR